MKAIQVRAPGGLDKLEVVDLPDPGPPGPGEIRVALHACSLNFHDYAVARGFIPSADRRIPMADGAGVVDAVGEGVTDLKPGDNVVSLFSPDWQAGMPPSVNFGRVPGDGIDGYARETVVVPATWFTPIPKGWSHAEAAIIPTAGVTAWRALVTEGKIKAGDVVLALGTGGVSIIGIQLAKAMGCIVVATTSSDAKIDRLRALGADHVINYKTVPDWGKKVVELTGGHGADHVLEAGGAGTLSQSIAALAMGGQIGLFGVLTGIEAPVNLHALMFRKGAIRGITVGSRADQLDMVRGLDGMGFKPVIDRSFPLEGIADAFAFEESGAHFGKIVLEW